MRENIGAGNAGATFARMPLSSGKALQKILPFALAMLLLIPLCASSDASFQEYKNKYGEYFQNRMDGWWAIAALAIFISVLLNALIYMAGAGIQSQNLKNHAKAEFLQVTASSMLIFFAVALLYTITMGLPSTPGSNGVSAFDFMGEVLGTGSFLPCSAAPNNKFDIWAGTPELGRGPLGAFKCKVQERITAIDNAYGRVVEANKPNEVRLSSGIYMFNMPVYMGAWDLTLHKTVEEAHLVASKMVEISNTLHAQYVLAEYMQKNMLTVFVPFGLVLRIFPLTRGVGGLFIALGVGFFFVWPTFYLLTDPTFVKMQPDAAGAGGNAQGVCFTGFKGMAVLLAGAYGTAGTGGSPAEMAISDSADLVHQLTVSSVFYPFVSLVMTLIFVRAMAPILGGDTGELMKMVSRLG